MEADIIDAFMNALTAAIPMTGTDLPLKVTGRRFEVPNNFKYYEVVQIRNNVENETWGDEKTYRGFFRVLLHWPKNDEGEIPAIRLLDNLASIMPKGSIYRAGFASVKITDNPQAGSSIEQETDIIFPLTFHYQDFQTA